MPEITIGIADPHPVARAGIRAFCGSQPGWRVTGECGAGDDLPGFISAAQPRYLIIDPAVFDPDATGFVTHAPAMGASTRLIVYADSREEFRIRSILRAGASAYVLKNGPSHELIAAISRVEEGFTYVTPLAGFLIDSETPPLPDPRSLLSQREYQVFLGLGSGSRACDVALSLGLSPKTVDTYRASILRKLNLDGLASLVRLAAAAERRSAFSQREKSSTGGIVAPLKRK